VRELRQSSSPVARLLADVAAYRSGDELAGHRAPTAAEVLRRTRQALAQARTGGRVERLQVAMFAGWLLCVVPPELGCRKEGRALLLGAWKELEDGALTDFPLPGLAARLRINTSWLLLRQCTDRPQPPVSDPTAPDRETLTARICALDPSCSFAEAAFEGRSDRRQT
jgi:hypothetical protein